MFEKVEVLTTSFFSLCLSTVTSGPPAEGAEAGTAPLHLLWSAAGERDLAAGERNIGSSKIAQFHIFLPSGLGGVCLFGCCLLSSGLCHIPHIQVSHHAKIVLKRIV